MQNICIGICGSGFTLTGAPDLRQTQTMKWRKTTRKKKRYENAADLWGWAAQHILPASLDDLKDDTLYAVQQNWPAYDETEGICLTGRKQVGWLLQMVDMGVKTRYGVKCDGKHKFHHGKWIIVTAGVHSLEFNTVRKVISEIIVCKCICVDMHTYAEPGAVIQ